MNKLVATTLVLCASLAYGAGHALTVHRSAATGPEIGIVSIDPPPFAPFDPLKAVTGDIWQSFTRAPATLQDGVPYAWELTNDVPPAVALTYAIYYSGSRILGAMGFTTGSRATDAADVQDVLWYFGDSLPNTGPSPRNPSPTYWPHGSHPNWDSLSFNSQTIATGISQVLAAPNLYALMVTYYGQPPAGNVRSLTLRDGNLQTKGRVLVVVP